MGKRGYSPTNKVGGYKSLQTKELLVRALALTHKNRESEGELTPYLAGDCAAFTDTGGEMAKDGTARGGQRVGAGTKRKSLADSILEGKAPHTALDALTDEPSDLSGEDMPEVSSYLEDAQKNGGRLMAKDIFRETWNYLRKAQCEKRVSRQLIEQYAMSVARWIQCEKAVSEYGFIAKHPTTGAAIASPYVAMSREYMKQINQCWYQIYQVVRDSASDTVIGSSPQDELMEKLLS